MNSIDVLKQKRDSGYGAGPTPPKGGAMDRVFTLTPEELKMVGMPGPVSCLVTGTLSPDGKLQVESVSAPQDSGTEEKPMMPMQGA